MIGHYILRRRVLPVEMFNCEDCGSAFQRCAHNAPNRRVRFCSGCSGAHRRDSQKRYEARLRLLSAPAGPSPKHVAVRASRAKALVYANLPTKTCPKCGERFTCGPNSEAVLCPGCGLSGMPDYTPRTAHPLADL